MSDPRSSTNYVDRAALRRYNRFKWLIAVLLAALLLGLWGRSCQYARIAAPTLLFKSEAIVHPDDVVSYIDPAECQISYNPLQMALLWNTLAPREVNLLQQALENRHKLPAGAAWVSAGGSGGNG